MMQFIVLFTLILFPLNAGSALDLGALTGSGGGNNPLGAIESLISKTTHSKKEESQPAKPAGNSKAPKKSPVKTTSQPAQKPLQKSQPQNVASKKSPSKPVPKEEDASTDAESSDGSVSEDRPEEAPAEKPADGGKYG